MVWFVSSLLVVVFFIVNAAQNVNSSGSKIPLNILVMVNWPDARNKSITGWDDGLDLLTGGRVAVNEINERNSTLKDYELKMIVTAHEPCAFTEGKESIANLVYYGTNPTTKVAAILGLYCSSSTRFLSGIAGSPGFDLIQLSASNSPIFNQEPFPRLWRFLQSADTYGHMMIQLMEKYGWTDISLVQDLRSDFYVGIASSFLDAVEKDSSINLVYHGGFVETNFIDNTLREIQVSKARIIFLTATETQVVALICKAYERGMKFPNYVWVVADYRYRNLAEVETACDDFFYAAYGSIFFYFVLQSDDHIVIESANISYAQYSQEYDDELEQVKIDYSDVIERTNDDVTGDKEYGGILYDQVWAFALAVNSALPELKAKNISIENYGFGQPDVTDILEDHLRKVKFQGASVYISFTNNISNEVRSRTSVYQATTDSSDDQDNFVGYCGNNDDNIFTCDDVNFTEYNFSDKIDYFTIKFPIGWGVAIIVVICLIVCGITFIFSLVIWYRTKPEVKATSPILSSIMFCGSYLICFAGLLHTVEVTFDMSKLSYTILCNFEAVLAVNGCNLIFVTLFIKLFRIFRIFSNHRLSHLGWIYNNYSLLIIVLIICLLPDIILIIMVGYDPLVQQSRDIYRYESGVSRYDVQRFCYSDQFSTMWIMIVFSYLAIFMVCVLVLSISTRKIQNENFKDTKKVNVFLFLTVLSFSLPVPCSVILLQQDDYYLLGNAISILGLITFAILSQVMLFMPKVLPIFFGFGFQDKWRKSSIARSLKKNTFLF